ncbi:MAG: creatininase family protein [Bacteroidota bacterium]|nr:creatininase family protein [Bacteroidota bacterium]
MELKYSSHSSLKVNTPNVALLPWGATEAHNQHLPYGSDIIQSEVIAKTAAEAANSKGAKSIVLPVIPFGNNAQHLDQIAAIHLNTTTAYSILKDVSHSLLKQGIDRLIIVNSHGGNDFKPLVRDIQSELKVLIILADLHKMIPDVVGELFDTPGDHAGELETSMMMYLLNDDVDISKAGEGKRTKFKIKGLNQAGVWTPRPWKLSHPDLGSGNPENANIDKGKIYFEKLTEALSTVVLDLSIAVKGDLPYI